MRRARKSERGFSLIELLVAMTIALFAISVTMGAFIAQQGNFSSLDLNRKANEAARDALLEMEGSLRRLGFGVDPRYALDFRSYNCPTPGIAPCRDRIDNPDEIVFVSRNPNYRFQDIGVGGCTAAGNCFGNAWAIIGAAATTISINANAGDSFLMGRVVLATCANGANATMATLLNTVTVAAPGLLNLSVTPASASPYQENNWAACMAQPGASLFLVDRFRYAIQVFNGVPWLVLDTGMDLNGNGILTDPNDLIPIAKGVEDMQISYGLNVGTNFGFTAPDAVNANWIIGDVSGTAEEPNPTLAAPTYQTPTNDPSRFNTHPANVRSVRVTLGIRSTQPDPARPWWPGDPLVLSENRSVQLTSFGGFKRYTAATTIFVRDMDSRSGFIF